ncbi:methyl-accepting chemotaxis sensory transducer [Rhodopseudomonas palustris BisB5]|uniref:Methyl-accepting chemotaxis sensory transducer n=1 Tax=Rhodopseudomonas palustris (strain BisB5) TaxID=316057 RepID=Q133G9_RHOPS|nr:methyl-accepting chemotaxis sensory transducer [Rhodopseudomonas palustris BisB5]
MNWLNNVTISLKIAIIVGLLAIVCLGSISFATLQMKRIDDSYSDLVGRIDKGTVSQVRAARQAEAFVSAAFQMATETTDDGVSRLAARVAETQRDLEARMADILVKLPEKSAAYEPILAQYKQAFLACGPAVAFAMSTRSPEDNMKAAERLKLECVPRIEAATRSHVKINDGIIAYAEKASGDLTDATDSTIQNCLLFSIAGLLFGLIVSLWIGVRGLSKPIGKLKEVMELFAKNDLNADIPGIKRGDELGEMARAVGVFKASALEVERLRCGQQESERRIAEERKTEMRKLADEFEAAVGQIVETVSSASTELEASASTLTKSAERTQEVTTTVAAASEEASANVQSVASATEEMASSINEISRQVQESARIANEAVDQARKTNDRVGDLAKAASRIGDVVDLINSIAGQTNLLALNATIEAARAGEAGRGFAVVASEVKALAEQTAKATGEIGQQITGMQVATDDSVSAIKEISGTIARMSEISSTIASAVEEQGAATQEISRNVQQAARGTSEVSSNISDVRSGASETGSASSQVLSAAQSLSRDSNQLKLQVVNFLSKVRAA